MADELIVTIGLNYLKNNTGVRVRETINIDVAGDSIDQNIQSIATSETELTHVSDISSVGYVFLQNLDETNYVEVGAVSGQYAIKLLAGQIAVFPCATSHVYARANTAACLLRKLIVEL